MKKIAEQKIHINSQTLDMHATSVVFIVSSFGGVFATSVLCFLFFKSLIVATFQHLLTTVQSNQDITRYVQQQERQEGVV